MKTEPEGGRLEEVVSRAETILAMLLSDLQAPSDIGDISWEQGRQDVVPSIQFVLHVLNPQRWPCPDDDED